MIRSIKEEHLNQALFIQSACYDPRFHETPESYLSAIAAFPEGCFGYFEGEKLLACCICFPWKGEPPFGIKLTGMPSDPEYFYLSDISVLPEARMKGIARKLMERCIEIATDLGLDMKGCAVQGAEAVWARMGFEIGEPIIFAGTDAYVVTRKIG